MVEELVLPATFEQLRTTSSGNNVRILVDHLVATVRNPALINALLSVTPIFRQASLIEYG